MKAARGWIFLFTFIILLLLRKSSLGGIGMLLNGVVVLLSLHLLSGENKTKAPNLFVVFFLMLSLMFLQLWLPVITFGWIAFAAWIAFVVFFFRSILRSKILFVVSVLLSFLFFTAVIFNERKFYNFYRYPYYEEYIRAKYTEQLSAVADLYIDRYKHPEKENAELILGLAISADNKNDNEKALRLYNQAIDMDPDNYDAYHRRGFLKLTKLDIDFDNAYSAIKDFNRAIHLKPDFTIAYFHRSLATGYIGLKGRSYLDSKIVWDADSILTDEAFEEKYGTSKTSFAKKFHP